MSERATTKGWPLHTRILAGLAVGAVGGVAVNRIASGDSAAVQGVIANVTEPIGALFLRLLLMTVIPLVFSSLVIGVAGIGDVRKLGRVGLKSFGYCFVISAISVIIGLALVNIIKPGKRIDAATAAGLQQRYGADAQKEIEKSRKAGVEESVPMQVVKILVPLNPVTAMAGETPNMLHLMFFAVICGAAITLVGPGKTGTLVLALEGLYAMSAKIIDLIMKVAPFAVACLVFNNTARFGLDLLGALGWFMVTVLLGLALHMFGT